MSPMLLVVRRARSRGRAALLAFVVLPAGPMRVPLNRLDPSVAPPASAFAGAGAALGAAVEKVLAKRGRAAAGQQPSKAGRRMSMRLPDFVLVVGLATVVLATVGAVLGGLVLGLLLLVGVPFGAKLFLKFRASRRQAAFADQLDDSLQLMAGSLRAGTACCAQADSVASEADAPTASRFSRIVNETRVGRDLNDALNEGRRADGQRRLLPGRGRSPSTAGRRQPGRGARRRRSHHPRAQRDPPPGPGRCRPRGELSAIVLMALPFGVTGFISVSNPSYIAKFTQSLAGYAMLAVAVVMLLIGGLWLRKTVRIKFLMGAVPASVLVAAFAVALAVPVLGWSADRPPRCRGRSGPRQPHPWHPARRSATSTAAAAPDGLLGGSRGWPDPRRHGHARLNRLAGAAGRPRGVAGVEAARGQARPAPGRRQLRAADPERWREHADGSRGRRPSRRRVLRAEAAAAQPRFGAEGSHPAGAARPLDQMTIAVEAGLGFESAMARAGANGTGPLAELVLDPAGHRRRAPPPGGLPLAGRPHRRPGPAALHPRAVVQADQYGVSIADVLRTQAQEMRLKRRQRAEEKAMQIPVKVIFPLILCILPTLFIVLLGPAVMDMIAAFQLITRQAVESDEVVAIST